MKTRVLKRKHEEIENTASNGPRFTLVVKLPIRTAFDYSIAQFRLSKASPSIPFRLFDLPKELQDEVFAFAYPENGGRKIVLRGTWQVTQMRAQKTYGTTPAACPPHKVNKWLVSKRYFRAAARAWAKAQDLSANDKCFELRLRDFGIFTEFATSAWVTVHGLPFSRVALPCINRFRALKKLVCVVDFRFFESIGRGFAWEVKFTDDELEALLEFAGMGVPTGLVKLHLRGSPYHWEVFNTAEERAMSDSNFASLERLMWRRKLADPQDTDLAGPEGVTSDRDIEQDTLYLGSNVRHGTPNADPPAGTEDIEQPTCDLDSKAQRNTTGEISLVVKRSIVASSTHMTSIVLLVTVAFILDVVLFMDIGKCNWFPLLGGALILAVCSVSAFASP